MGVLRTNCIDCLDRTNVAQYAYGLAALGNQLHSLGIIDHPKIDLDDPVANDLMRFYERMGDTLAHQYGGSAAHNKVIHSTVTYYNCFILQCCLGLIFLLYIICFLNYSLFSLLSVVLVEIFCSYLFVVFKVQCNINYCLVNNTLTYLLQREK